MTRAEFGPIMAYLCAAVGKEASREMTEVYYDLLGDLPLPALQAAARRVLLESPYPTLPTPGALRQAALSDPAARLGQTIRAMLQRRTSDPRALSGDEIKRWLAERAPKALPAPGSPAAGDGRPNPRPSPPDAS